MGGAIFTALPCTCQARMGWMCQEDGVLGSGRLWVLGSCLAPMAPICQGVGDPRPVASCKGGRSLAPVTKARHFQVFSSCSDLICSHEWGCGQLLLAEENRSGSNSASGGHFTRAVISNADTFISSVSPRRHLWSGKHWVSHHIHTTKTPAEEPRMPGGT